MATNLHLFLPVPCQYILVEKGKKMLLKSSMPYYRIKRVDKEQGEGIAPY